MVKPTAPYKIENQSLRVVPYALAALLVSMTLLQLLNFEAFVETLVSNRLFEQPGSIISAIILLTLQIFSLPLLLGLWLSPLARMVSSLCVLLAPALWTALVVYILSSNIPLMNTGMLGLVPFTPYASLVLSLALLSLSTWSFAILGGRKTFGRG